jgi:tetratricopeptide (TPR) repeat protein
MLLFVSKAILQYPIKMSEKVIQKVNPIKAVKIRAVIINILIVLAAFAIAFVIFIFFRNAEIQRVRQNLIPEAQTAESEGKISRAINLYKSAENEFPEDIKIKQKLGELYFLRGRYEDAKNYLEIVRSKQELSPREISDLGNSYYQLNNIDMVIELWSGIEDLQAKDFFLLAQIYYQRGEIENYLSTLAKIKDYKEPKIFSLSREKNYTVLLQEIDTASNLPEISNEPFDFVLLRNQIAEAKKQFDFNKREFAEVIRLTAFVNIRQCRVIENDIVELKNQLQSARFPTYQADFLRGKCFNELNNPNEAKPLIETAINSEKANIEYRQELANSYFLLKDKENLIRVYDEVFVIRRDAELLENLAAFLYKLDDKPKALENYNLAFESTNIDSEKSEIAFIITQIEFLDNKNISICRNNQIISALDKENLESNFLRGICLVYNDDDLANLGNLPGIYLDYLRCLESGNESKINRILDLDSTGIIPSYHFAVGRDLLVAR